MRERLRRWWFALVPAVVGVALALWQVGRAGPWLDELYTMNAVSRGLGLHVFEAPLLPYYAVAWVWSVGGTFTSIEWLRLLSGLSIAAGSVAVAIAGSRLLNPRVGFAAAMLFVLAPGVDRYAQEARVYAVAAALTAFATWALVEVLAGGRRRWWILYGSAFGTAALLLPAVWAVVPAHAVILLASGSPRRYLRDALTTLALLAPVLAIGLVLGMRFSGMHDWLAPPSLLDLPRGLLMPVHSEYTSIAVPVALVLMSLVSPIGRRWLLAVAASVAVIWVASYVLGSWWTARTFLPLASVLCIAAAAVLAKQSWIVIALAVALVGALALPDYLAIRQEGSRGPDVRDIAVVVDTNGQDGDRLTVEGSFPLDWVYALYLEDDPRFELVQSPPGSRYWEIGPEPSCARYQEWPIAGGATLRRCS